MYFIKSSDPWWLFLITYLLFLVVNSFSIYLIQLGLSISNVYLSSFVIGAGLTLLIFTIMAMIVDKFF